jgi:hypothetical protein
LTALPPLPLKMERRKNKELPLPLGGEVRRMKRVN